MTMTIYLDEYDIATQSIPLTVTEGIEELPSPYYLTYVFTAYETAQASRVLANCGISNPTGRYTSCNNWYYEIAV